MNFNCVNNLLGHCGTVGTRTETRVLRRSPEWSRNGKNRQAWQI